MNFNELMTDTDCNCIENAIEAADKLFARKINRPKPTANDFKSKWEKLDTIDKQHFISLSDCKRICGLKGISVNDWNKESKKSVINKFLTTFRISPKSKDSIFIFKLLPNAGLIEHTPSSNDIFHYDLYKSDEFSLNLLSENEVIYLNDLIQDDTTN